MKELTAKQEMFCREYLVDLNGTQAAIRAGYSEKTAGQIAEENLRKPEIASYVQSLMDERAKTVKITADDVLGDILETRKAAATDGKHADRLRANELLGKHLKLFTDKIDLGGQAGNPINATVTFVGSIPDTE